MARTDSHYAAVVIVGKRARQLNSYYRALGEGTYEEHTPPMVETEKAYSCSAWRDGCKFAIWKKIAGKKISPAMAKKLLGKGQTQVIKGFVGKSGKKFDARLKLEEGQVRFEFEG